MGTFASAEWPFVSPTLIPSFVLGCGLASLSLACGLPLFSVLLPLLPVTPPWAVRVCPASEFNTGKHTPSLPTLSPCSSPFSQKDPLSPLEPVALG